MTQRTPTPPTSGSGSRAALFILGGFAVLALLTFALYAGLRWLGPTSTLMNTTAGSPQNAGQSQPASAPTQPAPTPTAR